MSETTSILATIGKTLGYVLYGWLAHRYEQSKESSVTVLVLTTGKTKFVESYKSEFGSTGDVYMVDIEDEIMKQKDNSYLSELKQSDVTMYEAKLFPLAKAHLQCIISELKEMRVKKQIVVLCSSNNLKKYLKVKHAYYYTPSKRLFSQIETKAPLLKDYLNYVRSLLSKKSKTYIFNSFEELYNEVLNNLKIARKV
jgi:hypothetical protein